MNDLQQTLKNRFGFSDFRPHQEEIARAILGGRDVFAVLQTSAGKSICFQVPAVMMKGCTVVITPLISLMQDQVRNARAKGVMTTYLNSTLSKEKQGLVCRALLNGQLDMLYVAPERLQMQSFRRVLYESDIAAFVLDEVHSVSDGKTYRPAYAKIADITSEFDCPIASFTATVTKKTQREIEDILEMDNPFSVRASFDRKDITYAVLNKFSSGYAQIADIINKHHRGECGIVYCTTRDAVDETAGVLANDGIKALPYHSKTPNKADNQERWMSGDVQVVVATIAFGLGIDKPNVRFVIHRDIPKSIEGLFQESGRASRDGMGGSHYLLYSVRDVGLIKNMINKIECESARSNSMAQYKPVIGYCLNKNNQCRRQRLLQYFGEEHPGNCGSCDVCSPTR